MTVKRRYDCHSYIDLIIKFGFSLSRIQVIAWREQQCVLQSRLKEGKLQKKKGGLANDMQCPGLV